eukprot:10040049-Ditylum_brightwellii.AAC.2
MLGLVQIVVEECLVSFLVKKSLKRLVLTLSSVTRPNNPFCPTMHFNYQYFETDGGFGSFDGDLFHANLLLYKYYALHLAPFLT